MYRLARAWYWMRYVWWICMCFVWFKTRAAPRNRPISFIIVHILPYTLVHITFMGHGPHITMAIDTSEIAIIDVKYIKYILIDNGSGFARTHTFCE